MYATIKTASVDYKKDNPILIEANGSNSYIATFIVSQTQFFIKDPSSIIYRSGKNSLYLNDYSFSSFKRLRNLKDEIANIMKAVNELIVMIFNPLLIGVLNNSATDIIKMAPVNPIPKISIAKALSIKIASYFKFYH